MTDLNQVVLEGRTTSGIGEGDFTYLSTGTPKLTIHIANNKSIKQGEQWVDDVSFFDVVFWGKLAENMKDKIYKGLAVVVSGRMKQDRWKDNNGNNRSKVYLNGEYIKTFPKEQNGQNNNQGNNQGYDDGYYGG